MHSYTSYLKPVTAVAGALVASVAIAACGGSGHSGTAAASVRSDNLHYSACMRSHGVPDFPDATDSSTNETVKGSTVTVGGHTLSEPWQTVSRSGRACARYSDAAMGPVYTAAQLSKVRAGGLADAQCMRMAGFAWFPDLTIGRGPDGHAVEVGYPQSSHRQIQAALKNPAYRAAEHRCASKLSSTFAQG